MSKPKVATTSLAGCFGCHMSLLDIDDRILKLIELVDFDKSPIDDIKEFTGPVAVGLIEGGCCNEENVHVLQDFRKHCDVLISVGDCAIMGGIPAMRNTIPLQECLDEAYLQRPDRATTPAGRFPNDPELPLLLNKVYPCHEVVKIDYHLPGCPPLGGHALGGADGPAERQAGGAALRADQVRLRTIGDMNHGCRPMNTRRVVIEPVTRVEGHGKVTILLDENEPGDSRPGCTSSSSAGSNASSRAGPYWEVPVLVQRLCGICPVSHHLARGQGDGPASSAARS